MDVNKMDEIKKLEKKYFVVKIEDALKHLTNEDCARLISLLNTISDGRADDGKQPQSYVILNRHDNIDLGDLLFNVSLKDENHCGNAIVDNIAVDLVNAILKAR